MTNLVKSVKKYLSKNKDRGIEWVTLIGFPSTNLPPKAVGKNPIMSLGIFYAYEDSCYDENISTDLIRLYVSNDVLNSDNPVLVVENLNITLENGSFEKLVIKANVAAKNFVNAIIKCFYSSRFNPFK